MKTEMKSHKVYALLVLISAATVLVVVIGVRFAYENIINANGFPSWIDALMSIVLFLGVWHLFEKKVFPCAPSYGPGNVELPDISGRWVGFLTSSYRRDGQNVIVPITLEITQKMSCILVRAYFEKGYSESVMTSFETFGNRQHLYYLYDNAIPGKSRGMLNNDKGAVMLEYFAEEKKMLKGTYFNDLRPQSNQGEIRVSYYGSQLMGGIK